MSASVLTAASATPSLPRRHGQQRWPAPSITSHLCTAGYCLQQALLPPCYSAFLHASSFSSRPQLPRSSQRCLLLAPSQACAAACSSACSSATLTFTASSSCFQPSLQLSLPLSLSLSLLDTLGLAQLRPPPLSASCFLAITLLLASSSSSISASPTPAFGSLTSSSHCSFLRASTSSFSASAALLSLRHAPSSSPPSLSSLGLLFLTALLLYFFSFFFALLFAAASRPVAPLPSPSRSSPLLATPHPSLFLLTFYCSSPSSPPLPAHLPSFTLPFCHPQLLLHTPAPCHLPPSKNKKKV